MLHRNIPSWAFDKLVMQQLDSGGQGMPWVALEGQLVVHGLDDPEAAGVSCEASVRQYASGADSLFLQVVLRCWHL